MHEYLLIITQQAIKQYADAVENKNPIYYSKEACESLGSDKVYAPSSFMGQYKYMQDPNKRVKTGGVHTKQRMKFHKLIMEGDWLTVSVETVEGTDAKNRTLLIYKTTVKNSSNEIVCEGETTNILPVE